MFDPIKSLVYCYYFHDMQKILSKNKRRYGMREFFLSCLSVMLIMGSFLLGEEFTK